MILIILLSLLAGCAQHTVHKTNELTAEQVVREHFHWRNAKNVSRVEETLTQTRRGIMWDFDKLEYLTLLSIEEDQSEIMKNGYMTSGRGSLLKPSAVKVFKVEYEVKYKGGYGSGQESGRYTWYYILIKEKEDSSWLIDDWGV